MAVLCFPALLILGVSSVANGQANLRIPRINEACLGTCTASGTFCNDAGRCECQKNYKLVNGRCLPHHPDDAPIAECEVDYDCKHFLGKGAGCTGKDKDTGKGRCRCLGDTTFDPIQKICKVLVCTKPEDCKSFSATPKCDLDTGKCLCGTNEIKLGHPQKCTALSALPVCTPGNPAACLAVTSGTVICTGEKKCACQTSKRKPGVFSINPDSTTVNCSDYAVGQSCDPNVIPSLCPEGTDCQTVKTQSRCLCSKYYKQTTSGNSGESKCKIRAGGCCTARSDCGDGFSCIKFNNGDIQGVCACDKNYDWNPQTKECEMATDGI